MLKSSVFGGTHVGQCNLHIENKLLGYDDLAALCSGELSVLQKTSQSGSFTNADNTQAMCSKQKGILSKGA
ncbi:hypothetical protein TIFTF001_012269 [Ficus carica]|uniref:Uncharacterized protein n=1 Tax=Ficus carica TaxID=3494 RepID=A0AA88DI16_FICCA|nr:hypothetical protein TIFTF001_012269 [Ficus carica]